MKKLVKTIQSLFKLLFFTKYKLKFPQKNTTNAVILGNGPSLKQMLSENIDFLEDKNLFALNYFALSDEFIKLKPSNYVIIDFKFFSDNANDSHTLKNRPELWSNIGKIDWKMNLFLPFEAKKHEFWKPYISKNDFLNLYFLNLTAIEGFKGFKQACYKKMWGMPRPHNVVIPSLMISLKMQYENIYLWGVDHSWLSQISVDDNNNALVNNQHFYDKDESKADKFVLKDYPAAPLHIILYTMMTAFKSYFEIRDYADKLGQRVVNQTRGSMIDAFEREYIA